MHFISLSDIKSTKSFILKLSVIEGIHDTISIPMLYNSIKISGNSNINQICPIVTLVTEEGNYNFVKLCKILLNCKENKLTFNTMYEVTIHLHVMNASPLYLIRALNSQTKMGIRPMTAWPPVSRY